MTIDIDGSIKELSKWRKAFNYDNGDYCYGDSATKYSLDVAVETMRKYQKIQEIVNSKTTRLSYEEGFRQIKEVVEDGRN